MQDESKSNILTDKDAMDLLESRYGKTISPATLRHWRYNGILRYRKLGNKPFFVLHEFLEDIENMIKFKGKRTKKNLRIGV